MTQVAILGASKGLGAKLALLLQKELPTASLFLAARSKELLQSLARPTDIVRDMDFTGSDCLDHCVSALSEFSPDKLFYVAGGGPFGRFEDKSWKDHLWALKLNLLFPAELIHHLLSHPLNFKNLRQIIVVGSAVAGNAPDPNASSYAAAKHGLRGLVSSLQLEERRVDVQIYEPTYMDTKLLPPNAWPRQQGIAVSPEVEAVKLWQFSEISLSSDVQKK